MDRVPANHRLAERTLIQFVQSGEWKIDNQGRVWTCRGKRAEKRLQTGYLMVRRMINGFRYVGLAHRLVWQYFYGDIPPGRCINHRNGAKDDNRPENLEIVTYSENQKHAYRIGLSDEHGERNPAAKLSDATVEAIRQIYAAGGITQSELAIRYGVAFQTISKIIRGERRARQAGAVSKADHRYCACGQDPATGRFTGKHNAGRLLDGVEWNQFPNVKEGVAR